LLVAVREELSYISERRRAKKSVCNSVKENVGVRMAEKPLLIRDAHAAEDQVSALYEPVNVISVSYAYHSSFVP
jgi:hypothetical protein